MVHFGLTQRGHSHHQETWHSISVANGCTHLGFADPLSSSRATAGCPATPAVLPCHATAESHKQCVHWEPSSRFLGVLLFTDNAEITSAIVANSLWPISVTVQLSRNKPTRFQTDLSHRAGLPNACLHHTYPQQVRTKGPLEAHKTLPSSHRHLTFDLNSLSWDRYDCSLREKPSISSL